MIKLSSYDKHQKKLVRQTIRKLEDALLTFNSGLTNQDQAQVIAHFQKWFSTEGRNAADAFTDIGSATFDHRA